ncbi:MAG TPA: addiction module protein [Verrucomicrobiae bacterium]|nr:addiction module protein [Verrucomicrobiae bacterium]
MSALEIQQMPRREKLRLMEALWADLSRDEETLESPAWHADALRETAERVASGEEKMLDWEQAKSKLRKGGK